MNDDELIHNTIERYLLKEMTQEEQESFEKEVQQNAELKEQIALYKALYSVNDDTDEWFSIEEHSELIKKEASLFRAQETKEFSEKLKNFRATTSQKKTTIFSSKVWLTIASVIIIAVFILYPTSSNLSDIYEQYHNWEDLPSYTSKGFNDNQVLKDMESSFLSKDYQSVIEKSKGFDTTFLKTHPQVLLHIGVSYLETNQYENALASFDQLLQSDAIDFHKGYWYKTLVFLKQGNKEKALKSLEIILQNPSYYKHSIAKELKEELE